MAKGNAGVSGLAIGVVVAGGLFMYSAYVNVPVIELFKRILKGDLPTVGSGTSIKDEISGAGKAVGKAAKKVKVNNDDTPEASSAKITKFVNTAKAQIGKPYRWGAAGPDAFDCSGLVTYALKAAGLDNRRRITTQYLLWNGLKTVPNSSQRFGDLVCWTGHMGIAINNTEMVHAPQLGDVVKISKVWNTPKPVIRRLKSETIVEYD